MMLLLRITNSHAFTVCHFTASNFVPFNLPLKILLDLFFFFFLTLLYCPDVTEMTMCCVVSCSCMALTAVSTYL